MSDEDIANLSRGGHDPRKVYAAYQAALAADGPAVILAHTVKGWGIDSFEEETQPIKRRRWIDDLIAYRDALNLDIENSTRQSIPPTQQEDPDELEYLLERRQTLGGSLPSRAPVSIDFELCRCRHILCF